MDEFQEMGFVYQQAVSVFYETYLFIVSLNFIYLYKHHKHLYKQWLILHTFIQRDSEGSLSTFVDLYPWK